MIRYSVVYNHKGGEVIHVVADCRKCGGAKYVPLEDAIKGGAFDEFTKVHEHRDPGTGDGVRITVHITGGTGDAVDDIRRLADATVKHFNSVAASLGKSRPADIRVELLRDASEYDAAAEPITADDIEPRVYHTAESVRHDPHYEKAVEEFTQRIVESERDYILGRATPYPPVKGTVIGGGGTGVNWRATTPISTRACEYCRGGGFCVCQCHEIDKYGDRQFECSGSKRPDDGVGDDKF